MEANTQELEGNVYLDDEETKKVLSLHGYYDVDEETLENIQQSVKNQEEKVNESESFDKSKKGEWNEILQDSISQVRQWSARFRETKDQNKMSREIKQKYLNALNQLRNRVNDFEYAAISYGKIIISERFLPNDQKTIQPENIGGIAGGIKYRVQGIIFKFAIDHSGLYSSRTNEDGDALAAKCAGLELLSLIQFFNTDVSDIHVPFMVNIDYKGFRLVAMPVLPINSETLCYGSSDAGRNIHYDAQFHEKMKKATKKLCLKEHKVSDSMNLCGPIDIEGHRGTDNREYVIDLARLFPPEPLSAYQRTKSSYLYRLLRPELIKSAKIPVSSDAFSPFDRYNKEENSKEVEGIYQHLWDVVIPNFINTLKSLDVSIDKYPTNFSLSTLMHEFGINMRFLSKIWKKLRERKLRNLQCIFEIEILSRTVKTLIQAEFRSIAKHSDVRLSNTPYYDSLIHVLNNIFFARLNDAFITMRNSKKREKECQAFWVDVLFKKSREKFPDIDHLYLSRTKLDPYRVPFFQRICQLLNVEFDPSAVEERLAKKGYLLYPSDIIEIKPRINRMNLVALSEGRTWHLQGTQENNAMALRLFSKSLEKYHQILETTNAPLLNEIGEVYYDMAIRQEPPESLANLQKAKEMFSKAIDKEYQQTYQWSLEKISHAQKWSPLKSFKSLESSHTVISMFLAEGHIFSGQYDHSIKIWDLNKLDEEHKNFVMHDDGISSIQVQGDILASGSWNRQIKVWNWKTGEVLHTFELDKAVRSLILEGDNLFAGSFGGQLKQWNIKSGEETNSFATQGSTIFCLAKDEEALYSGNWAGEIIAWDLQSAEQKKKLLGHEGIVIFLGFYREFLLSGGRHDNLVIQWDKKAGVPLKKFVGHTSGVLSFTFYDNYMISSSDDLSIRVWNLSSGSCLKILEEHTGEVNVVSIHENKIVSAGGDKMIQIYDIPWQHAHYTKWQKHILSQKCIYSLS